LNADIDGNTLLSNKLILNLKLSPPLVFQIARTTVVLHINYQGKRGRAREGKEAMLQIMLKFVRLAQQPKPPGCGTPATTANPAGWL